MLAGLPGIAESSMSVNGIEQHIEQFERGDVTVSLGLTSRPFDITTPPLAKPEFCHPKNSQARLFVCRDLCLELYCEALGRPARPLSGLQRQRISLSARNVKRV